MPDSENTSIKPAGWARWRLPLMIATGVAALWTGVLGMWLPGWIKPRIETAATQALGTPVSIGQIHVQPWTGVVAIDGLSVGPSSAPMLRLQQAEVQLSLESVWRLAPVLRRVTLVKPDVFVERVAAQRFNFSPVLDKLMAAPKQPTKDDEPVHFAVFNIALKDGLVRYSDRVLDQDHRIDHLQLGVPFLSNLPSQVHVDVEPLLSARIDGSPLLIKGRTLPFTDGLKSEIDVKLDAVDVPHWIAAAHPFLPEGLKPDARSGRLDTALTIGFEQRKPPAVPRLSIKGGVTVSKLAVALAQAPGLGPVELSWDSLKIEGVDAAPLEHQVAVGKVGLDGVQWRSQLLVPSASPANQPSTPPANAARAAADASSQPISKPEPASTPWAWQIGQLRIATGRIDVQPVLPASSAKQAKADKPWPTLSTVRINADKLSSHSTAAPATWQIELHDEHDASVTVQGQAQVFKQEVDAQLDIHKLALQPWLAPLTSTLNLPLLVQQGELAVQAKVHARLKTASALEMASAQLLSGRVQLSGLDARATQRGLKDQIKLGDLTLDGMQADVDLATDNGLRSMTVDTLHVGQLDAAITRGPKGEWLGMPLASEATTSNKPASPGTSKPAAKLPDILLKALRCEACKLQLTDQTVSPAARFDLSQTELQITGASTKLDQLIQVELQTLAQGPGRVQFKGDVRPQPLLVNGRVTVTGLDLRAVQPYIDPMVNITVAAAKAQIDGQLKLQDAGKAGLQASYKGRAGLSNLRVQDRVNEADFLSWQALTLDGLDVSWSDQALDANLGRIALKDFYGRLIINPDGKLNLAGIMRHEAGGETRSLTTPDAAPAPKPAPVASLVTPPGQPAPRPKLRWQQIQLSKGRVDFTDNFIKPRYSARLTQVDGDVSAVSSAKPEPATIKISGAVDDAAPLLITGQIHPLGPQLFTDIQGSAKGIELTRLTPYAARYAGYAIEKGSLSVTVHYKVDGGKLEASNQIFLDQLTFGDKTDSPDATTLPVRFAVSLLKNSRGEIDVDLPISGSLDDPAFSVGGIIWRVVVNLITKAVTAPFALLSGGGSEELGLVAFDPGSAALTPAAQQRLDTLATKLQDRPALKLEATGRADPAVDDEGLRLAYVNRLMRAAKAKSLGVPVSDVDVGADERLTWLTAAYKSADIPKPRNLVGMVKTLSGDEMTALLKASAPSGAEALRALANRRGDVVKAYLATKLPPERVLLTASKLGAEGLIDDKGPTSRVQFEIK